MKRSSTFVRTETLESRTLFAITFADLAKYPVSGNTFGQPALADFNGDGFLDGATCGNQTGEHSVSVVLNQGNGTFGAESTFAVGERPFQVVAGDFNGDAKQDLACANVVDGTVSVLLGNGDGTFQPRVNTTISEPPPIGIGAEQYIAAVELNNDGKLDLVVNNSGAVKLATLLGNGDGSFVVQDQIFSNLSTLAIADFNGDAHPDVASDTGNDQALVVYFTDGAGNLDGGHTFPFVTNLAGSFSAEATAAGDFNGDGKADVAMTTLSGSAGLNAPTSLGVYLGNGDGTFQTNVNTPLATGSLNLSVADLDNDGKLDVVVEGLAGFAVLLGNGDGTFATPPAASNAAFESDGSATIGDVNNDGKRDLAFAISGGDTDALGIFLSGTGGGGGGGGGSGTATATPTIQATLPAAVVGGAKVKGAKVAVTVTNSGTTDLTAPVTVSLFASTDATVDAGDTAVGTPVTKTLKLKPGASKPVKLKLTEVPNVPDGDYFLLAQTTATGATGGTAATGTKVNIAAAFVDLTGTFAAPLPATLVPGKKASVALSLQNLGNVAATGTISINLIARPAGGGPNADVTLPTAPVKLKLNPGATKVQRLKVTLPVESLLPGSYTFVATIDSTNAIPESREDNNETTGGPAVVNP